MTVAATSSSDSAETIPNSMMSPFPAWRGRGLACPPAHSAIRASPHSLSLHDFYEIRGDVLESLVGRPSARSACSPVQRRCGNQASLLRFNSFFATPQQFAARNAYTRATQVWRQALMARPASHAPGRACYSVSGCGQRRPFMMSAFLCSHPGERVWCFGSNPAYRGAAKMTGVRPRRVNVRRRALCTPDQRMSAFV